MPALDPVDGPQPEPQPLTRLPFEPVKKSHILHCSYDYWHQIYRSSALKSRIIPLTPQFLSYLREDGIILPSETPTFPPPSTYNPSSSTSSDWDSDPDPDPSLSFPTIHQAIKETIHELGGLVAPKLNWSAPKDATWISMKKNSMECATPNDIYLLLKSSDFVTHDLEHVFDGCEEDEEESLTKEDIKYVLVLRKWFKVNPSCEFRCFVRERRVIGICQRDLNHFEFLFPMKEQLREVILKYFEKTLKSTFPDGNFVFDIYLPEPYDKVRLMDINPWAPRTDPLLFSWLELLTMPLPKPLLGIPDSGVDLPLLESLDLSSDEDMQDDVDVEEVEWKPEIRFVRKDDPEAYCFASPQYSAHKLPREVVQASAGGETGMREFADQWQKMMDGEVELQAGSDDDDDDEPVDRTTAA
ncbi:D123-domain-containing protein [Hyaloscypha bicolor E]|uniref:D123-domain-containing protein n=1 Tax=Hyaloscypha bicolor E TaxID=1095630 RepID=A0A2J6SF85_9HELO|nr:D123-domain-containing protein [Hyaloscypha bicolor E]PMD49419.1 D123-domain-containing protein [Hyaloscypha bicolor E]